MLFAKTLFYKVKIGLRSIVPNTYIELLPMKIVFYLLATQLFTKVCCNN